MRSARNNDITIGMNFLYRNKVITLQQRVFKFMASLIFQVNIKEASAVKSQNIRGLDKIYKQHATAEALIFLYYSVL